MSVYPLSIDDVRRALGQPRPGRAAEARLLPRPRPGDIPPPPPEHPLKEAGVLILLYSKNRELFFILTRRTETVARHKGQISLPGGAREGAEFLQETALRETSEELGLDADQIEILGEPLTPLYIPVSDFWVTAFVGHWLLSEQQPVFQIEPKEVIQVIETPLASILDKSLIQEERWELRGDIVRVPFFHIQGHKVWGATAMILSEFAALLETQLTAEEIQI